MKKKILNVFKFIEILNVKKINFKYVYIYCEFLIFDFEFKNFIVLFLIDICLDFMIYYIGIYFWNN